MQQSRAHDFATIPARVGRACAAFAGSANAAECVGMAALQR